ncbi:flavoprotein [Nocardia sp. NPDC057227]|uniref:flavoprotein n=1 Tax=Nocardia sp. NPDC057227 TaxID=3346056 RepID=UPI00362DCA7B
MPTLYLIICAAGTANRAVDMVRSAQAEGWSVHCIATPAAVEHFLDILELEATTGHEVRTAHRNPGDPPLPPADAVIVAPATYNTINKWAAGIGDTYVLIKLAELTGLGVPIVTVPYVNSVLAANRVFHRSLAELRESGIRVCYEPHPPGGGAFPWDAALAAVQPGRSDAG